MRDINEILRRRTKRGVWLRAREKSPDKYDCLDLNPRPPKSQVGGVIWSLPGCYDIRFKKG